MAPKLGIIAGGGPLPALVAETCRAQKRAFHLVALRGHADPTALSGLPADWIRLGEAGRGFEILRAAGVEEIVMIGPVRRPTLAELSPDLRTARFFARVGLKALGDDGLLRAVIREIESEGWRVVGADAVLGDCLAVAGQWGRIAPDAQAHADIARGVEVARALGQVDVGQSVVVQQGVVLGVEAVEGTDALIARAGTLARAGAKGVLVKIAKPGQDRRVDLPTIGTGTLDAAAKAGLGGIAVHAGAVLVAGPGAVVEAADCLGLFVLGIDPR